MADTVQFPNGDPAAAAQAQAAHDAAMAAKMQAQASGEPTATPPAGDQLIAGKFKTTDDLVKAYKELESKLGAPKAMTPTPESGEPKSVEPGAKGLQLDPSADATKVVEQAQLDMGALSAEYAEKGSLSDENYAKLAAVGISKEMVQAYAEGMQAKAANADNAVMTAAGIDRATFSAMAEWAQKNVSKDDIIAYNQATAADQPAGIRQMALEAMHVRFTRANGSQPTLFTAERGQPGASSHAYQSTEQMLSDMRNPLYQRDPAFRRAVEEKVARSNLR